jgi:hypothetical protein
MLININQLDIDFELFLQADYTQHTGSCTKHQVYELTDIHEKFGGFPDTYCLENTIIHQLWWSRDQIDFEDLGNKLNMEVITISSICQPPGCVIPLHRDTFFRIKEQFPNDSRQLVRANVYLEDYKVGQFIQYIDEQSNYQTSTNWRQGDGFLWDSEPLHLSANAGMQNKYTLQVSGFLKK